MCQLNHLGEFSMLQKLNKQEDQQSLTECYILDCWGIQLYFYLYHHHGTIQQIINKKNKKNSKWKNQRHILVC